MNSTRRSMSLRSFTPKRVITLLLSGCAIGLLMIRLGWAETSQPVKKHHPKHKAHSHQTHRHHAAHHAAQKHHAHAKKAHMVAAHHTTAHKHSSRVASHHKAPSPPPMPVKEYSHPEGLYSLHYPANWRLVGGDNAMVVRSAGDSMERGVFGVVRRPDNQPNEDAIAKEFQSAGQPTDLKEFQSQVAGLPATKVIGSNRQDPTNQMVEYYVQAPNGHQYYVLMMAPRNQWTRYTASFDTMLRSLSLN